MKYNKNFSEFLLDLLLEDKEASVQLPFVISDRLKSILESFSDNRISENLLTADNRRTDKKMTMLDIDEESYDKFTFTNSNKFWDYHKEKGYDLMKYKIVMDSPIYSDTTGQENSNKTDWTINRTTIKIGRFVNKMYPDTFHNTEIEKFVNEIKSKRKILESKGEDRIKVVEGEDIKKYYLSSNYDSKAFGGSPLGSSCMNKFSCQEYIDFYVKNPDVKLVLLMSDNQIDKISGRALLWDLDEIDDQKVERKFMDRIYYIEESDIGLFKDYATKNNWLYKENQNMKNYTSIYDPEKNESGHYRMKTTRNFVKSEYYPYMDTMKYFLPGEKFLTNEENIKDDYFDGDTNIYYLESVDGGYEEQGEIGIFVDHYGRYIDEDDLIYCERGDDWRLPDDAYFVEGVQEYATDTYFVENNMFEYDEENFFEEDGTYSDYLDKTIPTEYTIEVYRSSDYKSMQEVLDNEDAAIYDQNTYNQTLISYYDNISNESYLFDEYYCGDDFIDVKTSDMKESETISMHKKWDKDRFFKWKGEYYADVLNLKDILTGQKRIWKDENDL